MNEQDRKLSFNDLCARLPYDTIVSVRNGNGRLREDVKLTPYHLAAINIWDIKPYLRPMESMTEDEKKEFTDAVTWESDGKFYIDEYVDITFYQEKYDWLNAHYFDYRGLIEKGLALPAPEGMYNFKTE